MAKYSIPDDHVWSDEKEASTEDGKPVFEIEHHMLDILHRKGDSKERDIRYEFAFDGGEVFAIGKSHRLANSNQFDPMGNSSWGEVPEGVKRKLETAIGRDSDKFVDVESVNEMASLD